MAEYIKSIRIAKEAGIMRIEEMLLSHLLLPSGETVGEWVEPQVQEVYAAREMPALLPGVEQPKLPPRLQIAPASDE